ncbi:MAG: hypothetical protein Q8Q95_00090 [bacterium]|nr:hypothetical protein [bacterium]
MYLSHLIERTIELGETSFTIKVGVATLQELKAALKVYPDFVFLVAKEIEYQTPKNASIRAPLRKIERYSHVTEEKLEIFHNHNITHLQIIMLHKDCPRDYDVIEKMIEEASKIQEDAQRQATILHKCAVDVYKSCSALIASIVVGGINSRALDTKLVKEIASSGSAIRELTKIYRHILEDLEIKNGKILAGIMEICSPNKDEASAAMLASLDAARVAHWLNRMIKRGILKSTYPNLQLFNLEDLELISLAAFLVPSGTWGGHGKTEGYEIRSLTLIKILRRNNCKLPIGLEELVLHHMHSDWRKRFIYQVSVTFGRDLELEDREKEIGTVIFIGKDEENAEEEIYAELKPVANLVRGVSVLDALEPVEARTEVSRLRTDFVAKVLVLALTEDFRKTNNMDEMKQCIKTDAGYDPFVYGYKYFSMYAYVLAAICNSFRVLPVGAMVTFSDEGYQTEEIRSILRNLVAVVIHPKTEDTNSPYLEKLVVDDGKVVKHIRLGHPHDGKVYKERMLVATILSPVVFSKFFANAFQKMPKTV